MVDGVRGRMGSRFSRYQDRLTDAALGGGVDVPAGPDGPPTGYFSAPQGTLDPKVINPEGKLRSDVRSTLMRLLYDFWGQRYNAPEVWSTAWLAGSALAWQWSDRKAPDLDVLIGVNMGAFKANNPRFAGLPEATLATMWNKEFDNELEPFTDGVYIGEVQEELPSTLKPALLKGVGGRSAQEGGAPGTTNGIVGTGIQSTVLSGGQPPAGVTASPSGSAQPVGPRASRFLAEGAGSATPITSSTRSGSTDSASTGSPASDTKNWYESKMAGAQTAGGNPATSSELTTTTPPASYEGSSAANATSGSGILGTTLRVSSEPFNTSDGLANGPWSITFYVNPGAEDIRSINPYAAYDLTHDEWTVNPIDLPSDWDPVTQVDPSWWASVQLEIDKAKDLAAEARSALDEIAAWPDNDPHRVNAETRLSNTVDEAAALFKDVHARRKEAFSRQGQGYFDYTNFRWQAFKRAGAVKSLHTLASYALQAKRTQQIDLYGEVLLGPEDSRAIASLIGTPYARLFRG